MASSTGSTGDDRSVVVLPLEDGSHCLRGLSPRRLRFEVEYALERGTCSNSVLFPGSPALLVHPPGDTFAGPFLEALATLLPAGAPLQVVVGDVNPNRVGLL